MRDQEASQQLKQLQSLLDSTGIGTWDWQIKTGEAQFNSRWAEIIGYSLDELSPLSINTWLEHAHPDDLEKSSALLKRYWQGESDRYEFESRMLHKAGYWVWVLDTGKVIEWDSDGSPLRMVGTHLDITEQKKIDLERAQSESSLRNFFHLSLDLFCITDINGYFERINARFVKLLGYPEASILRNSLIDFVHPDDVGATVREINKLRQGHRTLNFTNRYRCVDGSFVNLQWSVAPDEKSGKLYATAKDISDTILKEQKISRQAVMMEKMSSQARIGAWEFDLIEQKIYWSPMTKVIHEVEPNYQPDLASGIDFYKEGESKTKITQAVQKGIEDGTAFNLELQIVTAKGNELWVNASGSSVYENGECVRLYGSFQDINDRKKNENELKRAKHKAEHASRAKSEFLAVMSHEIRTPLNGVMGMLNLLKRSELDPAQQRKVEVALSSADSLLYIINDILDFSKVDAGQLILDSREFNINEFLEETVSNFLHLAKEKGLELELQQNNEFSQTLIGDEARIRQIVNNLIANAIKFTDSGFIKVSSTVDHNGLLSLSVLDTGIGIAKSRQKALFEPFTQADASTTRQYGGTGLGLAICRKLCELMQGEIQLESEEGIGSSFNVKIPLEKPPSNDNASNTFAGNDAQLLILSPDVATTDNLSHQLRKWEFRVLSAVDPETAESLLTNMIDQVQLLFIDFEDNQSSATDFFVAIAPIANKKSLPIITLNAPSDIKLLSQHDVRISQLEKPVPKNRLINALEELLLGDKLIHSEDLESSIKLETGNETQTRPRVLLVEDNEINQQVAMLMLEDLALTVDIANDGLEALAQLKTNDYQMVLMDCQMPNMDGYEATRRIRSGEAGPEKQTVPIIALTANAMQGDDRKCFDAGMNDYLSKPFISADLDALIHKWLNQTN